MYFHVIMPVGSNPKKNEIQKIIVDSSRNFKSKPNFPKYATKNPVFSLQATLQDIRNSEFVLADLSLERPSCYYELGLAEALGIPVYLVAKAGTDIHQTASRRLVNFYESEKDLSRLVVNILTQVEVENSLQSAAKEITDEQ